ncbi:MAG TPA: retropepsin-like aspartic protease [Nitrospiraceae bacterium]|jgi:predicted aspartyl protease
MTYSFDPTQGLIIVPVRLFGPDGDMIVRLALDTGATSTLINSEIIVLLGYDPAASSDRIQVTTGSGVEFCPRLAVRRIEALGCTVEDFLVLAHTLPPTSHVDGLLGLDFFRGRQLGVDFRLGTITVT